VKKIKDNISNTIQNHTTNKLINKLEFCSFHVSIPFLKFMSIQSLIEFFVFKFGLSKSIATLIIILIL
jgi:hypothetical protein